MYRETLSLPPAIFDIFEKYTLILLNDADFHNHVQREFKRIGSEGADETKLYEIPLHPPNFEADFNDMVEEFAAAIGARKQLSIYNNLLVAIRLKVFWAYGPSANLVLENAYAYFSKISPEEEPLSNNYPEEPTMSSNCSDTLTRFQDTPFVDVTLIHGRPSSEWKEDELINLIRNARAEQERIADLVSDSTRMKKRSKELDKRIARYTEFLDALED